MDAALTSEFLKQADVACSVTSQTLQSCSLSNIEVRNCSANFTCTNYADQKMYACDASTVAQVLGKLTADMVSADADAQAALKEALANSPGIDATGATIEKSVADFVTLRCFIDQNIQQSVSAPRVVLEDCSNVNVVLMNRLDQKATCGIAQVGQLLRSIGFGADQLDADASGKPFVVKPVIIVVIVIGALVLLVIAIMLGLYLQRRRLNANYDAIIASANA